MQGGTYVDVFSEQLVGDAVLPKDVVVHARARGGRSEEESEESG